MPAGRTNDLPTRLACIVAALYELLAESPHNHAAAQLLEVAAERYLVACRDDSASGPFLVRSGAKSQ
jgi:hypothetical protein